jgi:hypothetical protein
MKRRDIGKVDRQERGRELHQAPGYEHIRSKRSFNGFCGLGPETAEVK